MPNWKDARQPCKRVFLSFAVFLFLALGVIGFLPNTQVLAWSEESLDYFDPLDSRSLDERDYVSPNVSSIHFDLVGALAIAAGFDVTDAAIIQAYSEATDAGPLPEENPVYTFDADPANYPEAPPITHVSRSEICPSPETTAPTVTMGSANFDMMECPGCFTDRFGPYGVFFHMPHNSADELVAIHDWAWGLTNTLLGKVTFGYSSTAQFDWQGTANVYETTPCFVQEYHVVDTGSIEPGSLQALGIYLHSLGDSWSHNDCLAAADALDLPFAAHVTVTGATDPLWDCRWTHHTVEFGDATRFPDSSRTFSGVIALYEALIDFAQQSERPIYRPIPLTAEENRIYDALDAFVHASTFLRPGPRRVIADELRRWAQETRETNPLYARERVFLPLFSLHN
ncbi:MAG: hypothetical protein GXP42_09055 [Chloroflexi bacterium]|nr:hypothetical protein [Chloroflexota bacterium]